MKQDLINKIILVTNKENIDFVSKLYKENSKIEVVVGGEKRIDSVNNALSKISSSYTIIHDSARCFISEKDINNLLQLKDFDAAYACKKVSDTIRMQDINNYQDFKTLNREELLVVETPQIFKTDILKKEFNSKLEYTDEISLLENKGYIVKPYITSNFNFKLTNLYDLKLLDILEE